MTIPQRTLDSLDRYVRHHVPTGGFLLAVLTNDLFGAVGNADSENLAALPEICRYVYNELPSESWGNKTKVWAWTQDQFYDRIKELNDAEGC